MPGRNDCRSARHDSRHEVGKKVTIELRPIALPPTRTLTKARPIDQHVAAALGSKTFGQGTHFLATRNSAEGREQQNGPALP
jgi:hypothetical protein